MALIRILVLTERWELSRCINCKASVFLVKVVLTKNGRGLLFGTLFSIAYRLQPTQHARSLSKAAESFVVYTSSFLSLSLFRQVNNIDAIDFYMDIFGFFTTFTYIFFYNSRKRRKCQFGM